MPGLNGAGKGVIYRLPDIIRKNFPDLSDDEYEPISPIDEDYNCIAWAAGDNKRWWEPSSFPKPGHFWPLEDPGNYTLDGYIMAFKVIGYEVCNSADLEPGFEKVAIYVKPDGEPRHMARQLNNGKWTSKLGGYKDIVHENLEGLEGNIYGSLTKILKRPRE